MDRKPSICRAHDNRKDERRIKITPENEQVRYLQTYSKFRVFSFEYVLTGYVLTKSYIYDKIMKYGSVSVKRVAINGKSFRFEGF